MLKRSTSAAIRAAKHVRKAIDIMNKELDILEEVENISDFSSDLCGQAQELENVLDRYSHLVPQEQKRKR